VYQGGPVPAQYQQGPVYQGGSPNPAQYQQAPYTAQYSLAQAEYSGGSVQYAPPPGPPTGFGSPLPLGYEGYGGSPMNQGPNYTYGPPQGYGGQPPDQQYAQPPPQQYAQPSYQQYGPPPQQLGGGGYGQWAGVAAGGLAGVAGGVFLAQEGGDIVDGIEDSFDNVQDFYDL
jgi:hypothetical protein